MKVKVLPLNGSTERLEKGTMRSNETQGTEAGDRDMNKEFVCISRNAETRTRSRQWSKYRLGKT